MSEKTPIPPSVRPLLRELPSVAHLLNLDRSADLIAVYGQPLVTDAFRETLDAVRTNLQEQNLAEVPGESHLLDMAEVILRESASPSLRPAINATGVIVHTNLGRAPLSQKALAAVQSVSVGYSNLEFDLGQGQRGSRTVHAERLLTRLTGSQGALVVNNNAAAVLLMLTALCQGREVIVSRGQLVEIGGGFRIPDVLAQSGARLVEVGTTNRTHLRDFAAAISEQTAAILVTHYSNYKIIGFTSQPAISELAELAHAHNLLLLFDQGSGNFLDVSPFGLAAETTVIEGLQAGCDVVAFSGDKLLGGPQAGILCGRRDLVDQLKQHPLARAVRADKMCLAALSATLHHYLTGQALSKIPVWWMIARSLEELETEATHWGTELRARGVPTELVRGESRIGGGSLPGETLPTWMVAIETNHFRADEFASRLRSCPTPVIGRIQDGRMLLDPRTVLPDQVNELIEAVAEAYAAD